jgi:hypothetical protein
MPREEAEAFLVEREGKVCVRLYKRQDGTVLTADCPVGLRSRRRRRAAVAAIGGGLMAAAAGAGVGAFSLMGTCPRPDRHYVMGEVPAVPEDNATATATPTATPTGTTTGQWTMGAPPVVQPPQPPRPLMGKLVRVR